MIVGKFVITMIAGHIFCILKKRDFFLESINCFPCVYGLGTNKSVSSYVWDNSLCKFFFESDAINGFFLRKLWNRLERSTNFYHMELYINLWCSQ